MEKTLQECKDIIAQNTGYSSWYDLSRINSAMECFTDAANKMYYEQSEVVNVEMANIILRARDAFIEGDYDEVWHQIYAMACPAFDEFEPWAELERITKPISNSSEI